MTGGRSDTGNMTARIAIATALLTLAGPALADDDMGPVTTPEAQSAAKKVEKVNRLNKLPAMRSITLGAGLHGSYGETAPWVETEGAIAINGGIHGRVKLARTLEGTVEYDFRMSDHDDHEEAWTPWTLAPQPNVRILGALHIIPNRYFSPFIGGGMGYSTACGFDEKSWIGQAGVESVVSRRISIRFSGQATYAAPIMLMQLAEKQVTSGITPNPIDYAKPISLVGHAALTWHL